MDDDQIVIIVLLCIAVAIIGFYIQYRIIKSAIINALQERDHRRDVKLAEEKLKESEQGE